MTQTPALLEIVGSWAEQQVKASILASLADGFRIVHMQMEKRHTEYVAPSHPEYQRLQHTTNSSDQVLVTYLARERK